MFFMTTAKSKTASNVIIEALRLPLAQAAEPRFNEVLMAIVENLGGTEDVATLPISFWLIRHAGTIAGYVAVGYAEGQKGAQAGDDVALGWFVFPDLRGQGIARAAVEKILNTLKAIPVNSVRVDIETDNEASLRLAMGFGVTVTAEGTSADGKGWKSLIWLA